MIPLSVVVTYACNRYVLSDKYTFHSLDGRLVAHGRIWWPINPFDIFNSFEQRCVEVAVGGTERFWPCEVLTFAVSHVFVEDADPITVTFESNRCVRVTVAEANLQYVLQRQ
jgi:hypothetical protein